MVEDHTTEATFVLLGMTADRILPITATDLARAYPDEYGPLPPVLQLLLGQQVTFEVYLPRNVRINTYEDIRISKIRGLVIPRAQLVASLPPPPPPRSPRFAFLYPLWIVILYALLLFRFFFFHYSCSPPARHDTPIPPDPTYVPPVPVGMPLSDVLPASSSASDSTPSDGNASDQTLPQDAPHAPIVTKFVPVFLPYQFVAHVCAVSVFTSSSMQTCNMSSLEKV
ncbi:hypothetical protein LINGRAHAP2_LOCUS4275 [Linum grandiflorum]